MLMKNNVATFSLWWTNMKTVYNFTAEEIENILAERLGITDSSVDINYIVEAQKKMSGTAYEFKGVEITVYD